MVEKIRFSREGDHYVNTDENAVLGWQQGVHVTAIYPSYVVLGSLTEPIGTMPRDEVVDNYLYRNVEWDDGPA